MAELKTKPNDASVTKFLDGIADANKRQDAYTLLELMQKATKAEPRMWGSSIVGFGNMHYVYDSGREGDWFLMGFSPRKANFALYAMGQGWQSFDAIKDIGKYSMGKGCLYIKKLDDVNMPALKKLFGEATKSAKELDKEMAKKKKK